MQHLILFLSVFFFNIGTQTSTIDNVGVEIELYGFTLEIPKDWKLDKYKDVSYISGKDVADDPIITVEPIPFDKLQEEEVMNTFVASEIRDNVLAGYTYSVSTIEKEMKRKDLINNGLHVIEYTFESESDGEGDYSSVKLWVLKDFCKKRFVVFNASTDKSTEDPSIDQLATLDEILYSIRIE